MPGVLEGLKVIDMGQVEAIPIAAAWMADWGAEVIKLEPFLQDSSQGPNKSPGTSKRKQPASFSLVVNRNKRSLAVDLKKEQGRDIAFKLIKKADVFMSNYRLNALKRLKMDYATLSEVNPGLIYATISSYGSAGPDKDLPGYDFAAAWARSGWAGITREVGKPPSRMPGGSIDRGIAAPHVLAGILAAVIHRDRTGKGQELDVSLLQSSIWTIALPIQNTLLGGPMRIRDRTKAQQPLNNNYRTKDDRWIEFSTVRSDPFWPSFCQALGRPEMEKDPRFNSTEKRAQNCEELICILDEIFATKNLDEWGTLLRRHNIIFAPVLTLEEVINDPQALANEFFVEMPHSEVKAKVVATPVKFHQNPALVRTPAPDIGQHNEEILSDLGYSNDDIKQLREQKIIP